MTTQYEKSTLLETKEVFDMINKDYSNLRLNDLPAPTHFVAKIIDKVIITEKEVDGQVKQYISFSVEYKGKNNDYEPMRFKVRVSPRCYEKFVEKYKDKEYVDKYAFFKKSMFQNKHVQSVYIIENYQESNTISLVKKGEETKTSDEPIDTKLVNDIIEMYKSKVAPKDRKEGQ